MTRVEKVALCLGGDFGHAAPLTDWCAVVDRVAAPRAGVDLELLPVVGIDDARIVDAAREGVRLITTLDRSVRRVLDLVHQAGGRPPASGNVDYA